MSRQSHTDFNGMFDQMPAILQQKGLNTWQKLVEQRPEVVELYNHWQQGQLQYCFALSDFIADSCLYHQTILTQVFHPDLEQRLSFSQFQQQIAELDNLTEEVAFMTAIRCLRRSIMVTIAVHDFAKWLTIDQSYQQIAELSDGLILAAYRFAYRQVAVVNGLPLDGEGQAIAMAILAMGKLGGFELNFSSDIDLIFCYPSQGQSQALTTGGRKSIDYQLFFTRVAQKLIHYLHHPNADGFVFRVDMRLRPFGESGPLVLSFSAMEDYYQAQGRDWERYAMLKSRVLIDPLLPSSQRYADELMAMLRPFVYRRYIDFSVIDSLRKMKQLIQQETRRKSGQTNIKLGLGGIREVEFIAQVLQLIRGGREKSLQVRPLLAALKQLLQLQAIVPQQYQILTKNYLILRRCEHYLQAFADCQTQTIPTDRLNLARLSYLFDFTDSQSCLDYIDETMAAIHHEFHLVIDDSDQDDPQQLSPYEVFWQLTPTDQMALDDEALAAVPHEHFAWLDLDQRAEFIQRIVQFKHTMQKATIGGRGKEVLDRLIPQLLHGFQLAKESVATLHRVFNVISKIASRTAYLELLNENAGALSQLVKLCSQSIWIAEQLALQPILLDDLIDSRVLYNPPTLQQYPTILNEYMLRIPADDLEQQLEILRHFKLSQQLRIAAADISAVLTVGQVSSHLTAIAEATVNCVVNIAWQQMVDRYGEPPAFDGINKGFGVIAYGKLGGYELGYGSDLDVVFVHDCVSQGQTTGHKTIDIRQFYLKLAQRIVHIFTTRTVSGVLYDMDTRLRPSGNSGLIAINIDRYGSYLAEEAWTWELQALVRARLVYGNASLADKFEQIRREILTKPRDIGLLRQEVIDMRAKMRDHLSKGTNALFDIKQGLGGIADIEFISQFLVLAYSHQHPRLTRRCANIELFELLAAADFITAQQAEDLTACYGHFRTIYHRLTLQEQDKLTDIDKIAPYTAIIQQIWQALLLPDQADQQLPDQVDQADQQLPDQVDQADQQLPDQADQAQLE